MFNHSFYLLLSHSGSPKGLGAYFYKNLLGTCLLKWCQFRHDRFLLVPGGHLSNRVPQISCIYICYVLLCINNQLYEGVGTKTVLTYKSVIL